jgi:N-acetylglucosaminyl-diphospho-decaprenol L-rhamnosyltransferase
MKLDVAVIIVSWNVRNYLADCLASVYAELARADLSGAVWVVDNASTDGSAAMVREHFPQAYLIENGDNPGFGAANNQGMAAAKGDQPDAYFLLNPDTILRPGSLQALMDGLHAYPGAGMLGARLVYGNGRFQHSAFTFPGLVQLMFDLFPMPARLYESRWNGRYDKTLYNPHNQPFPVDFPLGAAMLVRADVAVQTHGFDEQFYMYCEEIDWCWRIREAGWQIYTVPAAEVIHFGGESTRQIPARSIKYLWHSRAKLYHAHHARWRNTVAIWLVTVGMKRKLKQTNDPDLIAAYQTIIQDWQNGTIH